MPVYSYKCCNCGQELDHKLGFNDPHPVTCPNCGEECLSRVYKPVRVIFKGPGFYATDNRSPSGTKNGKVEIGTSQEKSDSSEKSETKTEAKSEKTKTSESKAEAATA